MEKKEKNYRNNLLQGITWLNKLEVNETAFSEHSRKYIIY